jgi:hypothetical protein
VPTEADLSAADVDTPLETMPLRASNASRI